MPQRVVLIVLTLLAVGVNLARPWYGKHETRLELVGRWLVVLGLLGTLPFD